MSRQSLLPILLLCLTLFVGVGNAWGGDVTDEITASDLAATGTSYTNFSNVTETSDAVYAGNSALNNSKNIQLRTTNSNSGIVSTTSGGMVKSVTITWASGSTQIDVYGSNTAYASAADLYDSKKQGTLLGNRTSNGTINVTDDYAYVGIRSHSGAAYLSKVEITWTTGGGCTGTKLTTPSVIATPSSNKVVLSWDEIPHATKYKYKWNGGSWTEINTTSVTKTGLTNNTSYTYQVQAIGDGTDYCDSDPSVEASAIPGTYYTVTFMRNGSIYDTKSIRSGTTVVFPDEPTSCDASKEFVGWTTTNIGSTPTNTLPTLISSSTTISSAKTYYAVFGTKGSVTYSANNISNLTGTGPWSHTSSTLSFSINSGQRYTGSPETWTVNKGSYATVSITTGAILSMVATLSGSQYYIKSVGAGTLSTSGSTQTISDINATSVKLNAQPTGNSNNQIRMTTFTVAYAKAFVTTCCTPLGQINGSFS
ncbi:MAG: fibronectin type III domain-containing protein [Paludibacteraceae bacterium]|nr:fibronectin type III domain-containing protein [Paludibacteraceae bacterium]